MKKTLLWMLAFMLVCMALGCGSPSQATQVSVEEQPVAASEAVVFADPTLEQMVRATLGQPDGEITAAQAAAVTRLSLGIEWQRYLSGDAQIQDISGLEYFTNLEMLDLSYHAIADISPLAGMHQLTALSLEGNPVADLAPLSELESLKALLLSGCAAVDYSPLSNLINLEILHLDQSTIADLSPLASLTKLKRLYLAGSPAEDYSPIEAVYPNLEERDFTIASALTELGFSWNGERNFAYYSGEDVSVRINHAKWGPPQVEWESNCIWLTKKAANDYTLDVGFYGSIDAYVFWLTKNGELLMNYVYDAGNEDLSLAPEDRERIEALLREALGETGDEDMLLAPIGVFEEAIQAIFQITPDVLYALPFAPPTLTNLGFIFMTDEQGNASYAYHEHEPHDMHISIYKQPWGQSRDGRSIEFYDDDFNGYSLLIFYFADEQRYSISLFSADESCGIDRYATGETGAEFPDLDTVQRMFFNAFETQGDAMYEKPLEYLEQWVQERFNMSVEELYALPLE